MDLQNKLQVLVQNAPTKVVAKTGDGHSSKEIVGLVLDAPRWDHFGIAVDETGRLMLLEYCEEDLPIARMTTQEELFELDDLYTSRFLGQLASAAAANAILILRNRTGARVARLTNI